MGAWNVNISAPKETRERRVKRERMFFNTGFKVNVQ